MKMENVMSWYQFAVFAFAMILVNVLTQAVIRGFFGHDDKRGNGKDGKEYVNHQTFSYKVEDIMKALCSLREEVGDMVDVEVCQAKMDKLEVVIAEIRKRLDSIETKLDKMLQER
jgi:uncharacterized protein YceH (UPF0502 family)